MPALVPTIPSVRSSIVSMWGPQCMECVPLMPSNAWHDQGADSTSQLWCLPHISINFSPIFLIFKILPLFAMLPPTKLEMREGICLNQEEGRRVACPACLVPVSGQEARPRISPLLRFLPCPLLFPSPPPPLLRSAVFAPLNAHSRQSWYGICCCSCSVHISLLSALSSSVLCFAISYRTSYPQHTKFLILKCANHFVVACFTFQKKRLFPLQPHLGPCFHS